VEGEVAVSAALEAEVAVVVGPADHGKYTCVLVYFSFY
jgi:hypothetical protein